MSFLNRKNWMAQTSEIRTCWKLNHFLFGFQTFTITECAYSQRPKMNNQNLNNAEIQTFTGSVFECSAIRFVRLKIYFRTKLDCLIYIYIFLYLKWSSLVETSENRLFGLVPVDKLNIIWRISNWTILICPKSKLVRISDVDCILLLVNVLNFLCFKNYE